MRLCLALDPQFLTELIAVDRATPSLECATLVLQHDDRRVGFDHENGDAVMRALVGDVVVVELANRPNWKTLERADVSCSSIHSSFSHPATLSDPSPSTLAELQKVSTNRNLTKQNEVLARHQRPAHPLAATIFDDWIAEESASAASRRQLRSSRLLGLLASCRLFTCWRFGDWGLYAQILTTDAHQLLHQLAAATESARASVAQVDSASALPVW